MAKAKAPKVINPEKARGRIKKGKPRHSKKNKYGRRGSGRKN